MQKLPQFLTTTLITSIILSPVYSFATSYTDELSLLKTIPKAHMKRLRGGKADAQGLVGQNRHGEFKGAEYQRGGMDTLLAGVVLGKKDWIDEGFRVADATFSKELPDGSFGDRVPTGGSFWLVLAARAFQVLKESEYWPEYQAKVEGYYPNIKLALDYLSQNRDMLLKHDGKTPNRLLYDANAFFLSSKLIGEDIHLDDARYLQNQALAFYDPATGIFSENGGGDSSYQAVNVFNLICYTMAYPTPSLNDIIQKGEAWELTKVLSDGSIDVTGNSRTGVGKEMYFGHEKGVNSREVMEMFDFYAAFYNDSNAQDAAERIFDHGAHGGE